MRRKMTALKLCKIIEFTLLAIFFLTKTIIELVNYTEANSAPFYVNIIINGLIILIPMTITFIIEVIIKIRSRNKNNNVNNNNNNQSWHLSKLVFLLFNCYKLVIMLKYK